MNTSSIRLVSMVAAVVAVIASAPYTKAAAPAQRYTYTTTSATVYDTKTKLSWQRTMPSAAYTWADATTYCASPAVSAALGGTGWRLPTIKELVTIVDYSESVAPLIDANAFPGTASAGFWSSTQVAGLPSIRWYVDFSSGNASNAMMPMYDVRCVR